LIVARFKPGRRNYFVGADGRIWTRLGPDFWQTRDGTVISDPAIDLCEDGRTKAEENLSNLLSKKQR